MDRYRPLGVPCFEDRLVQERLSKVLQAIWEPEFRDCSYGFRPGRSAHDALRRVAEVMTNGGTQWVVEADMEPSGTDHGFNAADGTYPGPDRLTTQQTTTYDDWGRTFTETDALGRTTRYTPDVHGDIARIKDPKGQVVERDFAFGGVLTEQRAYAFAGDPAPHVITYTRNPLGQATAVAAPEVDYTRAYDAAHRLARVSIAINSQL